MNALHGLSGRERNQNAKHDDAHLAGETAPAVQRFG
jgi:hypothetical protein